MEFELAPVHFTFFDVQRIGIEFRTPRTHELTIAWLIWVFLAQLNSLLKQRTSFLACVVDGSPVSELNRSVKSDAQRRSRLQCPLPIQRVPQTLSNYRLPAAASVMVSALGTMPTTIHGWSLYLNWTDRKLPVACDSNQPVAVLLGRRLNVGSPWGEESFAGSRLFRATK